MTDHDGTSSDKFPFTQSISVLPGEPAHKGQELTPATRTSALTTPLWWFTTARSCADTWIKPRWAPALRRQSSTTSCETTGRRPELTPSLDWPGICPAFLSHHGFSIGIGDVTPGEGVCRSVVLVLSPVIWDLFEKQFLNTPNDEIGCLARGKIVSYREVNREPFDSYNMEWACKRVWTFWKINAEF